MRKAGEKGTNKDYGKDPAPSHPCPPQGLALAQNALAQSNIGPQWFLKCCRSGALRDADQRSDRFRLAQLVHRGFGQLAGFTGTVPPFGSISNFAQATPASQQQKGHMAIIDRPRP